jgi:3-oxosteroid 1-dehydrogenase
MEYCDDKMVLSYAVHAREALKYFDDKIGLKMTAIHDMPDYYYGISNDGLAMGRMLEVVPFPAQSLGEWQTKTRVSPHVPYGFTHDDMFSKGGPAHMQSWDYALMGERLTKDERCLGPGLAGYFVKGVLDRKIPMHTGVDVQELIGDGTRIVGVRGVKDGKDVFVKANKGVVVAVSGYEKNQSLNKSLGTLLKSESMVFPTIDGANIRLAGPFGAKIAKVPEVTMFGYHVPGEERDDGELLWRVGLGVVAMPHTIMVNRAGKRFGNEAFYRGICYAIDAIDGVNQTHPNMPCWAILDSQAREKYAFGSVMPDQEIPEGLGVKANTLAELANKVGIDPKGLEATVANFNKHAAKGEDPEFQRGAQPWARFNRGDPHHKPNPNLGTLEKGPYYAVELHRMAGSAIPSTGLVIDHHSRVLGWDDKPIEGLYAAGNSTARLETGAMMQSGVSNGRGMTHGYLAGLHASGKPSTLLDKELVRMGL